MRNPDTESRFRSGAEVRAARRARRLLVAQVKLTEKRLIYVDRFGVHVYRNMNGMVRLRHYSVRPMIVNTLRKVARLVSWTNMTDFVFECDK